MYVQYVLYVPGKSGPGFPEEECPGAQCQADHLEGEGDEQPVTLHITSQLKR